MVSADRSELHRMQQRFSELWEKLEAGTATNMESRELRQLQLDYWERTEAKIWEDSP
jgi:hypothetical protein